MKNKLLLILSLILALVVIVPSSGFAADTSEKFVKAYDYKIPSAYTVKAIDTDSKGNVYYVALTDATHAKLFAISPTGKVKWSIAAPAGEELYLMTDYADHVYINIGNTVTSYSLEGKKNWTKNEKSAFSMTAGQNGIVLSNNKRIWAYDYNGKLLYDVNLTTDPKVAVPDIGDGLWSRFEQRKGVTPSIDVYKANQKLFSVTSKTGQILKLAAVSNDKKTVYISDVVKKPEQSGHLYAYDLKGNLKWTYSLNVMQWENETFTLDNGYIVFRCAGEYTVKVLSSEGKFLWEVQSNTTRTPINTSGNIIYIGNTIYDKDGNVLIAIDNPNQLDYVIAMDGSILFTSSNTIARYVIKYSDALTSWAYPAIDRLISKGIIAGYPDGTFKPGNTVSKEEFIKLLVGSTPSTNITTNANSFSDVPFSRWSYGVISEAIKRGIVLLQEEGASFRPASAITREQMAVYMARALDIFTGTPSVLFIDQSSIVQLTLVNAAASHGLISGYPDGSFKPKNNLTRAEAAVILTRVLDF